MREITDDQLGKFYRSVESLASQLGDRLSYSHVMETLQRLSDRTLRMGFNTTEDVQQLFQRAVGVTNILTHLVDAETPLFLAKNLKSCFANKKRYPERFETEIRDDRYISWPDILPGQSEGRIRVFKMKGLVSHSQLAAELLGVSDEVPDFWLQQLLVRRGHTLTLPAIEGIIELQVLGTDMGLTRPSRNNPCFNPCNLAFVEIEQGKARTVDVVYFSRETSKQWRVRRYPFTSRGSSRVGDERLVIRF